MKKKFCDTTVDLLDIYGDMEWILLWVVDTWGFIGDDHKRTSFFKTYSEKE